MYLKKKTDDRTACGERHPFVDHRLEDVLDDRRRHVVALDPRDHDIVHVEEHARRDEIKGRESRSGGKELRTLSFLFRYLAAQKSSSKASTAQRIFF